MVGFEFKHKQVVITKGGHCSRFALTCIVNRLFLMVCVCVWCMCGVIMYVVASYGMSLCVCVVILRSFAVWFLHGFTLNKLYYACVIYAHLCCACCFVLVMGFFVFYLDCFAKFLY